MRHIDVMTIILSEVTGLPRAHFEGIILHVTEGTDSYANLLAELPDSEANRHLTVLRRPASKRGILKWIVESKIAANAMTPAQRQRMSAYANNQQN